MFRDIRHSIYAIYRYFLYYVFNAVLFLIALACTYGQGHVDFPESRLHNAEVGLIGTASIAASIGLYLMKHKVARRKGLTQMQHRIHWEICAVYGLIMFVVTLTWVIRCAWSKLP